jgi:hypothetical protein
MFIVILDEDRDGRGVRPLIDSGLGGLGGLAIRSQGVSR